MSAAKSPTAVKALLETHVVGRTVRSLSVHGINALKTLEPPLAAVAGERVLEVEADDRQRVVLRLQRIEVVINLERTGGLKWLAPSTTWAPSAQATQPPTLRLL